MLDFADVQLFDESGTKFTHKYDTRELLNETHKAGFPSDANLQTDLAYSYIPHSLHFSGSFHGQNSGSFRYTSRERLDFTCSAEQGSTGNILVHVVTHTHAFCHIRGGIVSFEK